jgi:LysM repeat protein
MNESNQTPAPGGNKLMTIFLAVLGVHVVAIVAISAYYFLKGKSEPIVADTPVPAAETISADLAQSGMTPAPAAGTEATLDTESAPIISQDMLQSMDTAGTTNPMPATSDPIWQDGAGTQTAASATNTAAPAAPGMGIKAPAAPAPAGFGAAPAVEHTAAAPAPLSPEVSYTVVSGDSLYKIAKKHGVTVSQIKQANSLATDALKIGQKLAIPGGSSAPAVAKASAAPAPAAKTAAKASSGGSTTYQVAKGDTLWKIARKFGAEPKAIAEVNGISDPSKLKVGSSIKIPGSRAEAKQPVTQVRQAQAAKPAAPADMAMLSQ